MQIDISLFSILDILTASTALMLGLLFFTIKSQNRKANIFLGLFLWSISIQLINGIVFDYYEEEDLEFTFLFFDPILFILLFLFFYLNTTINKIINKWYYLLLIPGIIHNISINVEALDEVFEDYDDLILVFYFFEIASDQNLFELVLHLLQKTPIDHYFLYNQQTNHYDVLLQ